MPTDYTARSRISHANIKIDELTERVEYLLQAFNQSQETIAELRHEVEGLKEQLRPKPAIFLKTK